MLPLHVIPSRTGALIWGEKAVVDDSPTRSGGRLEKGREITASGYARRASKSRAERWRPLAAGACLRLCEKKMTISALGERLHGLRALTHVQGVRTPAGGDPEGACGSVPGG